MSLFVDCEEYEMGVPLGSRDLKLGLGSFDLQSHGVNDLNLNDEQ